MPRRARLDSPGTLHHVIVRGIEKRRIVDDDQDRKNFISRLGKLAKEFVQDYGISMAEVAQRLGVSTSAISKMMARSNSS